MSEGLKVLGFISSHGGCMLNELAAELRIPVISVHGWINLLCSTGYLMRCGQDHGECPCAEDGSRCAICRCSCHTVQKGVPMKIELTERGMAMVQRRSDEKKS